MNVAPASFVNGQYRIRAGLDGRSAGVAAAHEEAHGIIHRSTPYGLLLSSVGKLGPSKAATDTAIAHVLCSRGRTSEEVYATFASIQMAIWSGYSEALAKELEGSPEYRYYFDIGEELVRDVIWPYARIAVLEGVVRFCWSSSHVADALKTAASWPEFLSMPALAWPDARLSRLRKDWAELGGARLQVKVSARFRALDRLSNQGFSESFDPLHSVKEKLKGQSTLLIDTGPELTAMANRQSRTLAMLAESIACFVADHLAQEYEGTAMAAPTTSELYRYIEQRRKPVSMESLNLIESVENLNHKRPVEVNHRIEWDSDWEKPIIGVRSWLSFASNFEIAEDLRASRADNDEAIYATAFSLDARRKEQSLSDAVLPVALLPVRDAVAFPNLAQWIPPSTIVAAWSSIVLEDIETWFVRFHLLTLARYKVWIVADTDPQELVRGLRTRLGEVNAFVHNPDRSAANSAGLVVRPLDELTAEKTQTIRGIVFPGLGHTLNIILDMLRLTLADDFRGLSPMDIRPQSAQKRAEGQALVEWLIQNEHVFTYLRK